MQRKYSMDSLRKLFAEKGVTLLNTDEYQNADQKLYFNCLNCGKVWYTTRRNFNAGKNPRFLCDECNIKKKPSLDDVKKQFEEKGAKLISTEFTGVDSPLYFLCSKCGKEHHIKYSAFKRGSNPNLLCPDCQKGISYSKLSLEEVKARFKSKQATYLDDSYDGINTKATYKCDICGRVSSFRVSHLSEIGDRPLCPVCAGLPFVPTSQEVKDIFKSKGAKLLDDYVNQEQKIRFTCSKCGDVGVTTWKSFRQNKNPDLLCKKCLYGIMYNPDTVHGKQRTSLDNYWLKFVEEFFNVSTKDVSMHHILPRSKYPEYALSIPNGFPLPKELHSAGFVDKDGNRNPFHHLDKLTNPENWSDYMPGVFYNLNSSIITDIIDSRSTKDLLSLKQEYYSKGVNYIPFFLEEFLGRENRELCYSIIRAKLSKKYPNIWSYTNSRLAKVYARKCEIRSVPYKEEKEFLQRTHIQGFVNSKVAYGLYYNNVLVSIMTFGSPRQKKYKGNNKYELLRFSSELNTLVVGSASKLFNYFIVENNPDFIISYCDIRLSSVNPSDTLYPKLGFKYDGNSKPNYKWLDPELNRLFSRQVYQKHKLELKLKEFDPNLSETENMLNNGFIKQYDCGNHRFIWTAD